MTLLHVQYTTMLPKNLERQEGKVLYRALFIAKMAHFSPISSKGEASPIDNTWENVDFINQIFYD